MAKQSQPISAAELLAKLANNKQHQKIMEEKMQKSSALETKLAQDEVSLVNDLAEVGIHISSVWDLVNTNSPYAAAIPVLLKHLTEEQHHQRTLEGIARALAVPESQGVAFDILYNQFVKISEKDAPELKWLLGAALAEATNSSQVSRVIELMGNAKHGKARQMLIAVLKYLPLEKRKTLCNSWQNDPDLTDTIKTYMDECSRPGQIPGTRT